ncbi:glycopeptide [Roridomyces roridus]|uniref:Glycopeptide n=1 Tax=Roridomyces roridus TaxID=1738132 RepID=A0AAD7BQ72_9AGAR|nr:glycopeptide [Roridomyces roridus]KAJ7627204.1 glycopeptide [Roridomyces roridus]
MFGITATVTFLAIAISAVRGETHTITFDNRCGFGTPTLIGQSGQVLFTGAAVTINGPLIGAIAYLQTGSCGFNGEGCTLLETTLRNPISPGAGSGTDISLIPPHSFSVATGFSYVNGCDGAGADCTTPNCSTAFHSPEDLQSVLQCEANDVDLVITFCG